MTHAPSFLPTTNLTPKFKPQIQGPSSAMASKLCDSCKSATATLFCRADSAFLCVGCDSKVHAANKLASRHARVWLCEVCEHAPAHVTCKADAAALCVTCDRDIHSANPLARRHERVPVTPFYDPVVGVKSGSGAINFLDENRYFSDADVDADVSREEAEAASWLLPTPSNPKATVAAAAAAESPDLNSGQYVFSEMDPVPYIDLDYGPVDPKVDAQEQNSSGTNDGVVPVQRKTANEHYYDMDFSASKPFAYGYKYNAQSHSQSLSQCVSHSVSSSSIEVGVVPDGNPMSEISMRMMEGGNQIQTVAVQITGADREARVLRYREKRKNRKFEKTIRYASRKAYAETRPRIKGRFAKRSDLQLQVQDDPFAGYGVVPTC